MYQRSLSSFSPFLQVSNYQGVYSDKDQLEDQVQRISDIQLNYRNIPMKAREAWMNKAGALLEKDKIALAEVITLEMGKPIAQSVAEIEKCAHLCQFYASHAETWLSPRWINKEETAPQRVEYHPLGIVLGIMPWNFPFWQVFRCAVPALLAGNGVLMKHAPNVPLCALKIESILLQAGFPEGIYQNLFIAEEQVAELLADRRIHGVSLTGSEKAGRAVAERAGYHLKPQVMELGGSDPFIVMADADLETAVDWAIKARLICNGQSCIAAKRFLIQENVYDAFLHLLKQKLSLIPIGDPMDTKVGVGPLARLDLANHLREQVSRAIKEGVKLEAEYCADTDNQHFVPISILSGIKDHHVLFNEEVFGPVFSLYAFNDRQEALTLANATPFGLGASVWTNNKEDQQFFVQQLEAGTVAVNQMVASNAALPFGGVKNSGYGRELSEEGIRSFCNVKTIVGHWA